MYAFSVFGPGSTIGPETAGWYRNPITSLDDLKGLKIRFSGLGGMVLNEIGASATLMAGGEIFAALEKGTLDATEYSKYGFSEFIRELNNMASA